MNLLEKSVKGRLKIFLQVLPACDYCLEEGDRNECLLVTRRKVSFLEYLVEDPDASKLVKYDDHFARRLYSILRETIFFNMEEFDKLRDPNMTEVLPDIDQSLRPMFGIIRQILSDWPIDTLLFRALSSGNFFVRLSELLHSPLIEERALVARIAKFTAFSLSQRTKKAIRSYIVTLLNQLGATLYETRQNTEIFVRPMDQVFHLFKVAAPYATPHQLAEFTNEYVIAFLQSPLIKVYAPKVASTIKYAFLAAAAAADQTSLLV